MSLPTDIWADIVSRLPPRDYFRIGALNRACRYLLSSERFVRQWYMSRRPSEWNDTVLFGLMILMSRKDDSMHYPTINALANAVRQDPAAPLYRLCKSVLGPPRMRKFQPCCCCQMPNRHDVIKRTPIYASDGVIELVVLECAHAVVARKYRRGQNEPTHKVIDTGCGRGVVIPLETCGILRQCAFIGALNSDDPHLRDRKVG